MACIVGGHTTFVGGDRRDGLSLSGNEDGLELEISSRIGWPKGLTCRETG